MDEKIMLELKKDRISKMKNPTILLNKKDFEELKTRLESTIHNYTVAENPTYSGIPVKTSCFTDKGSVIVYDDISR